MSENKNDYIYSVDGEENNNLRNYNENSLNDNESAEKTLRFFASLTLICGIILTIILLFTICWADSGRYTYSTDYVFNPYGFLLTISTLLGSILSWAILRVFSNISINIREIRKNSKPETPKHIIEPKSSQATQNVQPFDVNKLHKGNIYVIKGFGNCKYTGVWENKYSFYPVEKFDKCEKPASPFLIQDVEPYFLIPKDSLSELVVK